MYAEWPRVSSEHDAGKFHGCRVSENQAAAPVCPGGSGDRAVQISDAGCLPSQPPAGIQGCTLAPDNALVPLPLVRSGPARDGG